MSRLPEEIKYILDTAVERGHMTKDEQGRYSLTDEGVAYYKRLGEEFGKRRPNGKSKGEDKEEDSKSEGDN